MKPFATRSRPLSAVAPLALALLASGCVLSSTHERLQADRDELAAKNGELEERVRLLTVANKSLDGQVASMVDQREDLLEEKDQLEGSLAALRTKEAAERKELAEKRKLLASATSALAEQSQHLEEVQGTYDHLVAGLESEVQAGRIRIDQLTEGLSVNVEQDILFPSGSAKLSPDGRAVLEKVAQNLVDQPYEILVEGHSDDRPIRGQLAERYPTNWELAGARAARVARVFVEAGIDGARIAAVSHGPYRPIASNDTAEGRRQNRRIEIRLRPIESASGAAKPARE